MATATADDVRLDNSGGVIAVADPDDVGVDDGLTDAAINSYLDDAAFEAGQALTDYDDRDTDFKRQLEKYLAALKIRLYADRAVSDTSRETASVSFEGMSTAELKREVDKRDPTGTLATQRETSRYVGSTHE